MNIHSAQQRRHQIFAYQKCWRKNEDVHFSSDREVRCIFSTFLISRLSSILINWLWTCFKYEKSYIFRFSLLSSIVQFIVSGHFMHCLIMCYPMTKNIMIVFKTTEKKTCVKLFKAIKYSRMASHTQNSRYYFHFYSHFRKKANTNRK